MSDGPRDSESTSRPKRRRRRRRAKNPPLPENAGDTAVEVAEPDENVELVEDNGFRDLGLSEDLMYALARAGFHTPSDIQRELIPVALTGRDCIGQARTGTGKTAAFGLPMLDIVKPGEGIQALVLVPTRELAMQVGEHVKKLSIRRPLRTLLLYGGTRVRSNLQRLKGKVEIVVGTPGRILDLIRREALGLDQVKLAVLDEVDRMLDIGFLPDIRRILKHVTPERQTVFVSATVTPEIRRLAKSFMKDPVEVTVSADTLTVDEVEQYYATVDREHKFEALLKFLRNEDPECAIVFTRTKRGAQAVARKLKTAKFSCAEIHGDLAQNQRSRVLKKLLDGQLKVLVATDLASRGLDISGISHIINYDMPEDPAVYVHRVGRTARMGRSGKALSFVTREEGKELTQIEMLINQQLEQVEGLAPKPVEKEPEPQAEPEPEAPEPAKPRTLGGRFAPRRRRRL